MILQNNRDLVAQDEALSIRRGRLFIEQRDAAELVREFGSPLFVTSEAQLRSNLRRYSRAFAKHWPAGVDILPAFKANWTLATRRVLNAEGAGADVYSEGELHGVLESGTDPALVSVNGGGKSEALLRKCVDAGVRITVEDLDEPARIDRIAGELGKLATIRLRVKPSFPNLWRPTEFAVQYASIDLGIQAYKSGIPAEYLPELGRNVLALPNVDLVGLHLHVGRHHPSLWYWRGVMRRYGELIADLCDAWGGWRPREIDVGGGFATPRDPFNKDGLRQDVLSSLLAYPAEQLLRLSGEKRRYRVLTTLIERLFARAPSTFRSPTIEQYAEVVCDELLGVFSRRGIDAGQVRLQAEPGRGVYSDAGVHLATVKKVKRQHSPLKLNWVLTDTTFFFLAGGTMVDHFLHDFVVANCADAPLEETADVVGHSCASDRILPFVRVPRLKTGDVIAFLDAGAYEESSASNFNALPRPGTVLVNGDDATIIRRAETIEDVFARDVVPTRLRKQAHPPPPLRGDLDAGPELHTQH